MPDPEQPDRHSREAPSIGEGTKVDLKFAVTLVIAIGSAVGSFYKLQSDISAMRYELQAEITRVETQGNQTDERLETKIEQVQETACAIAAKVDAPTVGCRSRRGP